jgi:hypothetical protein
LAGQPLKNRLTDASDASCSWLRSTSSSGAAARSRDHPVQHSVSDGFGRDADSGERIRPGGGQAETIDSDNNVGEPVPSLARAGLDRDRQTLGRDELMALGGRPFPKQLPARQRHDPRGDALPGE